VFGSLQAKVESGGMNNLSWDLIRAFLTLQRLGNFERAAEALGVDHSTMRRKIHALETVLATRLFVRRGGRYEIAPGLEPLLAAAARMDAASHDILRGTAASAPIRPIRISTLGIMTEVLAPDFASFRQQCPHISVDVTTEAHFVDLERDMVDLAIRLARPTKGQGLVKKLGVVSFGVFASPAYLRRRAERSRTGAAGPHDILELCVHYAHQDHDFLLSQTTWPADTFPGGTVAFRADCYRALQRLCESGIGVALLPVFMAEESGTLVRLPSHTADVVVDIWALLHRELGQSAHVRALLDFLQAALHRLAPRLAPSAAAVPAHAGRRAVSRERATRRAPPAPWAAAG
jgi:DNA-binding transcriptional LysR family regulator